jgi:hypothetical protein
VADKVYTINGGGGDEDTTIATGGNFVFVGDSPWTAAAAAWIKFYYTKTGKFKEIGRSA